MGRQMTMGIVVGNRGFFPRPPRHKRKAGDDCGA